MAFRHITLHITEDEAEDLIARKAIVDAEGRLRPQLERARRDREMQNRRRENLQPNEFICPKCKGIARETGGPNQYGGYCPRCGPI